MLLTEIKNRVSLSGKLCKNRKQRFDTNGTKLQEFFSIKTLYIQPLSINEKLKRSYNFAFIS